MKEIEKTLEWIKKQGLYPNPPIVSSPHDTEVIVNNKKVVMFATNNYLGMMKDPRVIEAAVEGVKKWGIGNGSARLLTGNLEIHHQLEAAIAKFKEKESALSFTTGFMANAGAIPALAATYKTDLTSLLMGRTEKNRDTIIFSDEYNHASIVTGIQLSRCAKEIYKHCDMPDLESRLKKYPLEARKIIITDGIFSMEGDIAPLPEIFALATKYNATTYLDDAHATCIFGDNGRGTEEHFKLQGKADVVMGTFTKAFGGVGGFIVGSTKLIDYVRVTADSFIFTAPIAPPVVYGLIEAIKVVEAESWRRIKVLKNAAYLREKLVENGFDILNSQTQIIPVRIGNEIKALDVSSELLERGIFVPAARWPAVSKGSARLRLTVSCDHTDSQMDFLVSELNQVRDSIKL